MTGLAALTILLPFAAAFAGFLPYRSRRQPAFAACGTMAVSGALATLVGLWQWSQPGVRSWSLAIVETGGVPIRFSLEIDGTAALVGFMVCCVAMAVQVYSVAYLRGDPRYASYTAFVSLFTAAMLLVVYAGDLLVLYVGWEVMGVCSYFLIGHHWESDGNSAAAVKAFLVTRVGDVGLLFGVFALGVSAGTFSLRGVLDRVPVMSHSTLLTATLLILLGVAGKSAQFPLHTWLPDAMAGPTPISALIHAATMVAAGIYVVIRLYPAFLRVPFSLSVLAVMAMVSMLGAALAALAQDDLKRVLAYSTISQLGFMAAGLAAGSWRAALFHLLTHAAFKALLFLAAGCVITSVGSTLLASMGGLRYPMPLTFLSMTVGYAALAGVPPFSGFFSKDVLVETAWHPTSGIPSPVGSALLGVLLLTVFLTGCYATRAWLMTFFGEPRSDDGPRSAVEARESPALMRWTALALAVPAAFAGFAGVFVPSLRPHFLSSLVSVLCSGLGILVAFLVWNGDPALDPARRLGWLRPVFAGGFFVDGLYSALFVRPVLRLARLVVAADSFGIDTAVESTGPFVRRAGGLLRRVQNGNAQAYLTGVLAGMLVILVCAVVLL